MATLQEVRDDANATLRKIAHAIFECQGVYLAQKRHYWQAAWTHSSPPADGVGEYPDLFAKVSDVDESWIDMGFEAMYILMPFRLKIDVYERHGQCGYVIVAEAGWTDKLYRRTYAVGPNWFERTHDWKEVDT